MKNSFLEKMQNFIFNKFVSRQRNKFRWCFQLFIWKIKCLDGNIIYMLICSRGKKVVKWWGRREMQINLLFEFLFIFSSFSPHNHFFSQWFVTSLNSVSYIWLREPEKSQFLFLRTTMLRTILFIILFIKMNHEWSGHRSFWDTVLKNRAVTFGFCSKVPWSR